MMLGLAVFTFLTASVVKYLWIVIVMPPLNYQGVIIVSTVGFV